MYFQGHLQEIAELKRAEKLSKQKKAEEKKASIKKEKKPSQKEQLIARKKGNSLLINIYSWIRRIRLDEAPIKSDVTRWSGQKCFF
jgi:hypothetical protein